MAKDRFSSFADTGAALPKNHFLIQPNDNADLTEIPKAIYCQTAGTIVVRDQAGVDLPYTLSEGQILLFRASRIMATGTTGTFYGWL